MKAIILAAGYATRLYPLTKDVPKALLPIDGREMLCYLMDQVAGVPGLTEAHIVTNHRFYDQFMAWLDRSAARYPRLSITVWDDGTSSDQNKLGAIGDIWFTIDRAHLNDDLLICASDNFFTFPLTDFVNDFYRTGKDTLLMAHVPSVKTLQGFAVATLDEKNRVIDLVEKPQEPPTDIGVYALYLYRRDTLPLFKQYLDSGLLPDAPGRFPEWLHKRRDVRGYLFKGECIDIGTPEMYEEICKRFSSKKEGGASV